MRLGLLLCKREQFAKAAPLFRRASLVAPAEPTSLINLASALLRLGDDDGATAAYSDALALDPSSYQARLNLGMRLFHRGRLEEARLHYQILVDGHPNDALARWNVASIDGLRGDLDAAFAGFAHESSMRSVDVPRHLPRWAGEPLAGRRLIFECEQGLGDTIMFARLAPLAREAGGQIILRTQPELHGLLSRHDFADVYLRRSEPARADLWHPLAELPAVLGVERSLAAAQRPYLCADPERVAAWSRRLPATGRRRVGLVWAGNPTHARDAERSLRLQQLLQPRLALAGIEWISLQKGPAADQADASPLVRADREIADFEDTAAILSLIDLLITVDTSVLHLAGAMGRPVWGMINYIPDWRWMMDRPDSPWYPTLRLFRQPSADDWDTVVREVAEPLVELERAD